MATLEEINSAAYLERRRKEAEGQLAPSRDLALNEIGLGEQGLGVQETDINRGADTLAANLREQALNSNKSLEERQNQLGLLSSGLTASGLGDIQKNLNKGIQESEADRASRLANLALQRAGLGIKKTEVQQNYNASVSDLVNRLLNTDRQNEIDRLNLEESKAKRVSSASSSGGLDSGTSGLLSTLLGGGGDLGPIPETPPKQEVISGIRVQLENLFRSGQLLQDTEQLVPYLRETYGLSDPEIYDLIYKTRKPFENTVAAKPGGLAGAITALENNLKNRPLGPPRPPAPSPAQPKKKLDLSGAFKPVKSK